jgi:RNA polymerase sigma factor (sigma-70 family)
MMLVNEAWECYNAADEAGKLQAREQLGEALLKYVKALVKQEYRSQFDSTEDAVGESIVKIFSKLGSYNPELAPFPVWVKVIVCNTCTDLLRDRIRRKEQPLLDFGCWELDEAFYPETSHSTSIALKQLTDQLPPEDRALVQLKLDGLSPKEMADYLKVPIGSVKRRWFFVCEKLRTLAGGKEVDL